MPRDHRHLIACQEQYRQNEPAGEEDITTGVEVCVMGDSDMCGDHRHLIGFQKQYRQNEPAGRVEVPTGVDVCVMADPRHM